MIVEIDGTRYVPIDVIAAKKKPFHRLIKEARDAGNESLDEASKKIPCARSFLWQLERGACQPTLPMIQRILAHYGLRFEQIAQE